MLHKLLVVTFYNDLPNFRIFIYLLNKFWKGTKHLKVVYSLVSDNSIIDKNQIYPKIIDSLKILSDDWVYEIFEGDTGKPTGYDQQQIHKLHYSSNNDDEYTIVFDCKNFITKDFTYTDLLYDGKIIVDEEIDKIWIEKTSPLFPVTEDTKFFNPCTPWIWKNSQVLATKNYLESKLGNLLELPCVFFSEYISVGLYCTCILKIDQYHLVPHRNLPVVYHHRIRNIDQIQDTVCVLKLIGVPQEEIRRWSKNILLYSNAVK